MEERVTRLEPLQSALSAWRGVLHVERQRRSRLRCAEALSERLSEEREESAVWRTLLAWRAVAAEGGKENRRSPPAEDPEMHAGPKGDAIVPELPLFASVQRIRARSAEGRVFRPRERRALQEQQDSLASTELSGSPRQDLSSCGDEGNSGHELPCTNGPPPNRLLVRHQSQPASGSCAASPRIAVSGGAEGAGGASSSKRIPRPASTGCFSPCGPSGALGAIRSAAAARGAPARQLSPTKAAASAAASVAEAAAAPPRPLGGSMTLQMERGAHAPSEASPLRRHWEGEREREPEAAAASPQAASDGPPRWADVEPSEPSSPSPLAPLPRGPERFFYDKTRYTGCARFGGPSILDRRLGQAASGAGGGSGERPAAALRQRQQPCGDLSRTLGGVVTAARTGTLSSPRRPLSLSAMG